jgi:hypothetical protein
MARTFVTIELRDHTASTRFADAMEAAGFVQHVKGRIKGQPLRLPAGMFLLENSTATQTLELVRRVVRETAVQAHIFCIPAGDDVRFGNLQPDVEDLQPLA